MNSKVYTFFLVGKEKERFTTLLNTFDNITERIKDDNRGYHGAIILRIIVELTDDEVMLIKLTLDAGKYIIYTFHENT